MRSYTELADFRQSDFTGYPVVFCDDRASRMSKPYSGVVHDSSETATLAAKELLSLGFKDYAFVGNLQPREWNLCNEMLSVVYKVGCRGLGGRIPAGSEATRGGGIYTDISGNANVKA